MVEAGRSILVDNTLRLRDLFACQPASRVIDSSADVLTANPGDLYFRWQDWYWAFWRGTPFISNLRQQA